MPGKESLDDVRIGDFERPLAKPPTPQSVAKEVLKESPTAQKLEDAESRLASEIEKTEKDLTPLERYEKMLKEVGVSREEAAMIVDEILTKGYWEKDYQLTPRRKVTFRTRAYHDTQRFYDFIEVEQPKNASYYNELLFKFSLAGSLAVYCGKTFEFPTGDKETLDKAFEARLKYIASLGDPAIRLLYAKLGKFDELVRIVTEEGAVENF